MSKNKPPSTILYFISLIAHLVWEHVKFAEEKYFRGKGSTSLLHWFKCSDPTSWVYVILRFSFVDDDANKNGTIPYLTISSWFHFLCVERCLGSTLQLVCRRRSTEWSSEKQLWQFCVVAGLAWCKCNMPFSTDQIEPVFDDVCRNSFVTVSKAL